MPQTPFILLMLFVVAALAQQSASFKDLRDGKTYRTVEIGAQVWFAENLQFAAVGSKCYDNKPEYCEKYGRLYDWNAALKACPKGWHLPTNMEWDRLYRFADGTLGKDSTESPYKSETAGKYLKATSGWNYNDGKSGNDGDKFGFAALPGGGGYSDGDFYDVGDGGYWWSATEYDASHAYSRGMYYNDEYAYWGSIYKDYYWFSVRCVKD